MKSYMKPGLIRKAFVNGCAPGDVVSAEAVLDVRVGGSFRIIMRSKARVYEHIGTYQIVDPPAKLAFTWAAAENPTEITLVTVEFLPHGAESELVITHEGCADADAARRYKNGWGAIADKFATYLVDHEPRSLRADTRSKQ